VLSYFYLVFMQYCSLFCFFLMFHQPYFLFYFILFYFVNIAWCLSSLHFFTNASIALFLVFISFAFFLNNLFFNLTLIAIKKKFNCFFLACLVFVSYVHMLTVIFEFFFFFTAFCLFLMFIESRVLEVALLQRHLLAFTLSF